MTPGELQSLFSGLKIWEQQERRAPHKPLLALWAIGRCLRNEARLAPYEEIASQLGYLLGRFGPPRKRLNPEVPYWYLQNDGVWEVPEASRITKTSSGDPHIGSLRREGARGGLPVDMFRALRQDRATALDIAHSLLDAHFPDTWHDDILRAVGIIPGHEERLARDSSTGERRGTAQEFEQVWRRWRDPAGRWTMANDAPYAPSLFAWGACGAGCSAYQVAPGRWPQPGQGKQRAFPVCLASPPVR